MSPVGKVSLVGALVVLAHLALVWWLPSPQPDGPRVLEDDSDRHVYFMRGSWLPRGQTPYLEVHSEYPELATWSFALPYLVLDAPASPAVYEQAPPRDLFDRYANLHSALMAAALIGLILVTARICRRLGTSPWRALFLLLPATMYFALSRYDALPVFLISASLLLLIRGQHLLGVVVVSAAVLTKWYAILFLPLFWSYVRHGLKRPVLPAVAVSALTAAVVVGTTFVWGGFAGLETAGAAERAAAGSDLRLFVEKGAATALHPYLHQGSRISNPGGLYQQLDWWLDLEPGGAAETWILRALAVLQFLLLPAGFLVRIRSPGQLVRWMALATAVFVLFAKFYSPQWVMWTTALVAPFMRRPLLVATCVALELVVYAQFSLLWATPWRGPRLENGTIAFTDAWYHVYDVRIVLMALFTLAVLAAVRETASTGAAAPAAAPVAPPGGP